MTYSGLARCLRLISRSMASRMNSPRLFGPARTSMRSATSVGRRKVVTTVALVDFRGGRPMRRVVPESCSNVKSPSVSYYDIDRYNVLRYKGQRLAIGAQDMSKHPNKEGLYWAALDDGDGNVEVAALRVEYFAGCNSFDEGAMVHFVDGSGREFELTNISQDIVRPTAPGSLGFVLIRSGLPHVRVTWHGPVKPPASARKQGPEVLA